MYSLCNKKKELFIKFRNNRLPISEKGGYNSDEILQFGFENFIKLNTIEEIIELKDKLLNLVENNRVIYESVYVGSTDKLIRKIESLSCCEITKSEDIKIVKIDSDISKITKQKSFIKYKPISNDTENIEEYFKICEDNFNQVQKIDLNSKKKGQILGRYIRFPRGDGYAYYQIVGVKQSSVLVELIRGIGDDWIIPEIGESSVIPRNIAEQNIYSRDMILSKMRN